MVFNRFRPIAILAMAAVVTILLATRSAMTGELPSLGMVAAGVLACATATVLLSLFAGPPPSTIAQVLYDVEQGDTRARKP